MLHCKMLKKTKIEALELSQMNYDKNMNIPNYVADDLIWRRNKPPAEVKNVRNFEFQKEISNFKKNFFQTPV